MTNLLFTRNHRDASVSRNAYTRQYVVCWNDWMQFTGGQSVHRFKLVALLKAFVVLHSKY